MCALSYCSHVGLIKTELMRKLDDSSIRALGWTVGHVRYRKKPFTNSQLTQLLPD